MSNPFTPILKSQPLRDPTKCDEEYPPPNFDRHKYFENLLEDVRVCVSTAKARSLPVVTPAGNKFVETVQSLHSNLHDRSDLGRFERFSLDELLPRVLDSRLNSEEAMKNEERYFVILTGDAFSGEENVRFSERQGFRVKYEQTTKFWLSHLAKLHMAGLIKVHNWPKDRVLNEGAAHFCKEYGNYFLPEGQPAKIIEDALRWVESPNGKAGDTQSDNAAGAPSRVSNTPRARPRTLLQRRDAAGNPYTGSNTLKSGAGTLLQLGGLAAALFDDDEFLPSDDDQRTVVGEDSNF